MAGYKNVEFCTKRMITRGGAFGRLRTSPCSHAFQMALVKALLLPCMQVCARSGSSWIRRHRFNNKARPRGRALPP